MKKFERTEMLLHWIIAVTTAMAVGIYFVGYKDNMGGTGSACLKYYTTDSNILACVASVLCLLYPQSAKRPGWLKLLQFVSAVAVSVTFLTVVFFLAPTAMAHSGNVRSALFFFGGNVFVLHLSTPLLSVAALLLPKQAYIPTKRRTLWALLPVLVYSLLYMVMVVFLGKWNDWYGFTFGGHYELTPLVMVVMYLFTAGIAFAERALMCLLHRTANE